MTSHPPPLNRENFRAMALTLEMAEMRDEIERLREENERLSAEVARLKATRAAVVKACEVNKITLVREALKLSESSEEPDPNIKLDKVRGFNGLEFHPDADEWLEFELRRRRREKKKPYNEILDEDGNEIFVDENDVPILWDKGFDDDGKRDKSADKAYSLKDGEKVPREFVYKDEFIIS